MDFSDLKNKSVAELKELLQKAQSELFDLKIKAHNHTLKQVNKIKSARQTIAQIMTLLTAKQKNK